MARLLIFLCVCVFQIVFSQIVDEECETVVKSVGTCLNIKLCPPYVTLLENFGSRPDVQNFLRTTTCGSEGGTPKVCCPRQFLQPTTTNPLQPPTTKNPFQPATAPLPSGKELAKSIPTDATDLIPAFPSPPECGVSNATFGRVVGGEDAKLGDLPWMALLGYKVRPSLTSWLCGGSLISPRHVITAAHCIHKQENSLYVVRLGELDLASEEDGATPLDVLIKSMIQHERYDPLSFENDIGLLVMRTHVQYSELIRPICLPVDRALRAMDFVDWTPLVAGWGQLSARGAQATHLQVLQLPVLPNDVCVQTYSVYEEKVIDERIICAGYVTGGRDTCSGDSGGPLMQPMPVNFTSFYYQIGVISFGPLECARPGLPGIYTRITSFMPWLQTHVIGTP